MKKILGVFLLVILCFCVVSCQKTNQKPIDVIYIRHNGNEKEYPEYKIDLKNKKFWELSLDSNGEYSPRNASAKDEGFTFVSDLDEDKIKAFIMESSRCGFTRWKNSYKNHFILDGHQWSITIMFSDSTKKEIYGSNKYPKTWDSMNATFKTLTGEKVLSLKNE